MQTGGTARSHLISVRDGCVDVKASPVQTEGPVRYQQLANVPGINCTVW